MSQTTSLRSLLSLAFLVAATASLATIVMGCYGRPAEHPSVASASTFGVQPGHAAVVTFSALWCHPCREEIESLNHASQEFAGKIEFTGFLVEGEEKGSTVQTIDIENFKTFNGEKPLYPVHSDENWQLFDGLRAPQGRALPTMVIFNKQGQLQEIVQQSLDYETQLRPLLQAIASGQAPAPVNTPTPTPPPSSHQATDTVQNWSARAEVASRPTLLANLTAAWQTGLQKYDFTVVEMPLSAGVITFLTDANGVDTPQGVHWLADTPVSVCQLQLNLNPDGTLLTSNGSCRPK